MDYIVIYWGASTPSASNAPTNNLAVIGRDATYVGTDKSFKISSLADLEDAGVSTGSLLYKTCASIFKQKNVGSMEITVIPYPGALESKSFTDVEATGAVDGSNDDFYTPNRPVVSINAVKVDFNDGSGMIAQTVTTHYTAETLGTLYTGKFTFGGSANGPIDGGGNGYSGQVPVGSHVYASYQTNVFQDVFNVLSEDDQDIQLEAYAYDVAAPLSYSDGAATGLFSDYKQINSHCAAVSSSNKWRIGMVALPSAAKPNESATAYGGAGLWNQIRDEVGQSRNFVAIKANPTTTLGSADDDPAGCLAGMIVTRNPHDTLTLQEMVISQINYDSFTYLKGWESAQVIALYKDYLDPDKASCLTYGFTFGTSREARINNVRSKFIVARKLYTNMYALLKTGTIKYNAQGMSSAEGAIEATLRQCIQLKYIDGIVSITTLGKELFTVPYATLTDAQKALYAQYKNSGVFHHTVTYVWDTAVEKFQFDTVLEV